MPGGRDDPAGLRGRAAADPAGVPGGRLVLPEEGGVPVDPQPAGGEHGLRGRALPETPPAAGGPPHLSQVSGRFWKTN